MATRQEAEKLEHRIRKKDNSVVAALTHYRSALMREASQNATFARDEPLQSGQRQTFSPVEYSKEALELRYV